ncbi:unnamed protein product [Caenorhabditis angaria]|uniref:Putative hydroxypyruvate isomerase n=1 Tax=Caenorhabditis angaria TaxID=860376 RepID=A0A9P1IJE4_9PELO|nr:unnamed protein product [Caenorhabditis angaria]
MSQKNTVSANLHMLFTSVPFMDRYRLAAEAGFRYVEVPFPYQFDVLELKAQADKYHLKHSLINGPTGDWDAGFRGECCLKSQKDQFRKSVELAILYANTLECPRVHIVGGLPVLQDDIEHAEETYLENLKYAADELAKHNILCLIEPASPLRFPGIFLNNFDQAKRYVEMLNCSNLKILFDYFHAQQICGQLTHTLATLAGLVGYVQVGQVPHRGDCSTPGEIDYTFVFSELQKHDPELIVGLEYLDDYPTFGWLSRMNLQF